MKLLDAFVAILMVGMILIGAFSVFVGIYNVNQEHQEELKSSYEMSNGVVCESRFTSRGNNLFEECSDGFIYHPTSYKIIKTEGKLK